ncbi:MAG: DNA polymerase I, partial [Bryobacterales bacterium]|nr:DNA polymerase I [Bryobacterales bacterium]
AAEGELALESMIGIAQSARAGRAVPEHAYQHLRAFLADPSRPKLTHDAKSLLLELARLEMPAAGLDRDVMLEAFLLNPDPSAADMAKLSERYLDRRLGGAVEQRASAVIELAALFTPQLDARPEVARLYREVEMPLAAVLARMEHTGIRIETAQLGSLSKRMDAEIQRLSAEIHELAGHPFN